MPLNNMMENSMHRRNEFSYKHALRKFNNRAFCVFYLINLSLGLLGFISIDSFKGSVNQQVSMESQKLLGADLALRACAGEFTSTELEKLQTPSRRDKKCSPRSGRFLFNGCRSKRNEADWSK